ncbi:SDR family NAD(P)-dependent oxidoreductase [Streptomyces krungchingensis]
MSSHAGRLSGKRVLITGSGGGQGEAAQALCAREGARVVGCDAVSGAAESAAHKLAADGYDTNGHTIDLTDPEAAHAWVEGAAASLGSIDMLHNNAAGFGVAPFADFTLAAEGAPGGIRANAISPGFVSSTATDVAMDDDARNYILGMHLIQQPGTGQDVAAYVLYLASDESSWVTGQKICIDGGLTAGYR